MLNFGLLSRLTYAERICAFAGNVVRVDDTNNIEAKIGGSAHNSARYMHTSACYFKSSIGRRRDDVPCSSTAATATVGISLEWRSTRVMRGPNTSRRRCVHEEHHGHEELDFESRPAL